MKDVKFFVVIFSNKAQAYFALPCANFSVMEKAVKDTLAKGYTQVYMSEVLAVDGSKPLDILIEDSDEPL